MKYRPGGVIVAHSSGALTQSGQVVTGRAFLCGLMVSTDGVNDVTVNLYNGTDANGSKLISQIKVRAANDYGGAFPGGFYIKAENGIYISIAGTGAEVVVYYDRDFAD